MSSSAQPRVVNMAVAGTFGPQGLVQLGVSISDIALIYAQGRKIGNWLTAANNERQLFNSLCEDPESILKRRGLVEPVDITTKFPDVEFIYHEGKVSTKGRAFKPSTASQASKTSRKKDQRLPVATNATQSSDELGPFSWVMVMVVTALDICLTDEGVLNVLVSVFGRVLGNKGEKDNVDDDTEAGLRTGLVSNIESWRSVGQVRRVDQLLRREFQSMWQRRTNVAHRDAIAQLNWAEEIEMMRFLRVLLEDKENYFSCESASTIALAYAIQRGGILIEASGAERSNEAQLLVEYTDADLASRLHHPRRGLAQARDRLQDKSQMISYPRGQPGSMIQAIQDDLGIRNELVKFWAFGFKGGCKHWLIAETDLPYSKSTSEVYYRLTPSDGSRAAIDRMFQPHINILAGKAFPCQSQAVLEGLEELVGKAGLPDGGIEWLEQHAGHEYLIRNEYGHPNEDERMTALWLKYQALVFGFYYGLLQPLVSLEYVNDKVAYFRGLWGSGSTTFLAMCTSFSKELREEARVSRTHVLHMLATMYNGRSKLYNRDSSRLSLLGVLGKVSVVAMPLVHTTDVPSELSKFVVLDLPIVHLIPESDGELYASPSYSIKTHRLDAPAKDIPACRTSKKWSVHSSMASVFPGSIPGVVLAARCEGRLVGWFTPIAADTIFLSHAYQKNTGEDGDTSKEAIDRATVKGFQVVDEDWQTGSIPVPGTDDSECKAFGVVQSSGCAALRYAATGFYAGMSHEVAISNGDIQAAFGRIEAQGQGIIIC